MSAITTSSVTRCPSQQESAWGATEVRHEKVILEVVRKGIFVVKCWRVCWTHLQIFSVSTVLGEKASDVKQSWEASAKSPDRRPSPRWTGRGPVNEGIMFGKLSVLFFYFIFFFFFFFRSVHRMCLGMDVWMNVFTMLFLCADSGPCSKMSRAWPPMSAITTSSVTRCPSHQESAWGATEARQEKVILEVVRKGIFVVKCWSISWTHLQMFSVSTVLGEKATDVKQSWEASAKLPDRRPSPRWTGRGPVNEGIMFGKLSAFFFFFFRSVHGVCMGMDVWMNVFTMLFLCADSGPWSKMSRAWPPMSAITTSSVTRCSSHQESAWGATEARQEKVILEVVRKGIFVVKCWSICWTHLQMFSVRTVLGGKASDVEQSWEASAKPPDRRPSPRWTGRGPVNEGIMFGKLSAFFFIYFFF